MTVRMKRFNPDNTVREAWRSVRLINAAHATHSQLSCSILASFLGVENQTRSEAPLSCSSNPGPSPIFTLPSAGQLCACSVWWGVEEAEDAGIPNA